MKLLNREERRMKDISGAVRLPTQDQFIAPVTILDGQGTVVRVVPAAEFRRLHPIALDAGHARGARRREPRRVEPASAA
jgi:hypothetical protein